MSACYKRLLGIPTLINLYNDLDIWVSNIKKLVAIAPQQVMLNLQAYFLQQIKKFVLTFRNQFKNFKIVGLT